jgi:hypothetical protein
VTIGTQLFAIGKKCQILQDKNQYKIGLVIIALPTGGPYLTTNTLPTSLPITMTYNSIFIFAALLPVLTFAQTYTASFTEYGGCSSTS